MFQKKTIEILKESIHEHHKLYKKVLNKTLKPKHHYLLHYVEMIENLGPPRYLSCLRFEGKHKILKLALKSFTSRVDPAKSIAIKYQF